MPKTSNLAVGILMIVTGLGILVWMPKLKKQLAQRQQTGERTAEEVQKELRMMMVVMIGSLIVGSGLVCSYALRVNE